MHRLLLREPQPTQKRRNIPHSGYLLIIMTLSALLTKLKVRLVSLHVRAHRDGLCDFNLLPRPAQLNVLADELAPEALEELRTTGQPTAFYPLPACRAYLCDGIGHITSCEKRTFRNEFPEYEIRAYLQQRNGCQGPTKNVKPAEKVKPTDKSQSQGAFVDVPDAGRCEPDTNRDSLAVYAIESMRLLKEALGVEKPASKVKPTEKVKAKALLWMCPTPKDVSRIRRRTNYLKATLAIRATIGPTKETAMMTPAALNAGDRVFCVGSRPLAYVSLSRPRLVK
jgi:hypothetical protein